LFLYSDTVNSQVIFINMFWKGNGYYTKKNILLLLGVPFLIFFSLFLYYIFAGRYVHTDNAYIKAAKTLISAEVNGKVTEVLIKDNSRVKAGQILFKIDDEPFKIAVDKASANLNNVVSELESMKSAYEQKQIELAKAEENVTYNKLEHNRFQSLAATNAATKAKFDEVTHNLNIAIRDRDSALKELESQKAKLDGDPTLPIEKYSRYLQALSELDKAKLELTKVNVIAPYDGIVANLSLEPGQYVQVGVPVFSIVNDKNVWVEANFKETELTYVQPGQNATIEIDTYPDKKWNAKVVSITPATGSEFAILPPQNSSGNWVKVVQRVMVRIEFMDYDGNPPLTAGLSCYISIDTGSYHIIK